MATTKDTHTANGTEKTFGFTFPYIKQSDVKVNVDNAVVSTDDYSLSDATHVQFNTAPANGKSIDIYRSTSDSNLVATFYPGSAIRSADLNDNFTQNLYTTQETTNDSALALDNSRVLESGSYVSAITKATNAVTTANTADTNATAAVATANTASTNASNAVTTANTASTNASNAVTTANAATATADAADTKADTAITDSASAVTTANTASTNASNAVTTANSATTTANAATTTANTASTNASNAVTTANAAADTAQTAADTVAASAVYVVVNTLDLLPDVTDTSSDPYGEDATPYYQVKDSTKIQEDHTVGSVSWDASDVTGMPAGFVGDDELAVKLKANITATPAVWEWQEYYATDPETRYRKKLIVENLRTISETYTIGENNNGFSIGPVTISDGAIIEIPENSKYVVMN